MPTVMGCIADDFSGATDLAGLLARSGVRVSLRLGVPSARPEQTAPFEVIALKCRTAPVEEAVSECRKALSWLQRAGAKRFFWKYCSTFDCTPDGNIGPVAEALMNDLGVAQTMYCPAFPENGRAVFMGNLFVGREPLAESPMKDHPLTPMRESNLMRLLAPQVTKPVGLADRLCVARGAEALRMELERLDANGVAHVVIDAVANEDLFVIAQACRSMRLMTGGSAVAMALPALYLEDGTLSAHAPKFEQPALGPGAVVLSGSCSAMTRAQVRRYLEGGAPSYQLDPVALAESGSDDVLNWFGEQDLAKAPLIYATAEPEAVRLAQYTLGVSVAGQVVEETLAQIAAIALARGVSRFVVAGGETSGAVTQAMNVDHLEIGPEIAPGVPWCFAKTDDTPIALTLKSGNFGAETFFEDALHLLEAST